MTRNPDCNLCHGSGTITGTGTRSDGTPCACERQAIGAPSPDDRAIDNLHRRLAAIGVNVSRDVLVASIWREGYLPIVQRINGIEIDIRNLVRDIGKVAMVTTSGGKMYRT